MALTKEKLIEVFGKGGPARDIMLGTATGGEWADEICDTLVTALECEFKSNAVRDRINHLEDIGLTALTMYKSEGKYQASSCFGEGWKIEFGDTAADALNNILKRDYTG